VQIIICYIFPKSLTNFIRKNFKELELEFQKSNIFFHFIVVIFKIVPFRILVAIPIFPHDYISLKIFRCEYIILVLFVFLFVNFQLYQNNTFYNFKEKLQNLS